MPARPRATPAFDPAASRLLVVGHGSKFGPASAEATQERRPRIARAGSFASVATAFLEEPPFLKTRLRRVEAPTVVAGFFFGDGMHAGEDVPAAIAEAGAAAPSTRARSANRAGSPR